MYSFYYLTPTCFGVIFNSRERTPELLKRMPVNSFWYKLPEDGDYAETCNS